MSKSKSKSLSKEDRIRLIEERLPNAGNREFAALNRELSILKGEIKPGEYVRRSPPKPEPEPENEREDREEREYQAQDRAYEHDPEHTIRWWAIYLVEQLARHGKPMSPVLQRRFDAMSPEQQAEFRGR